MEEHTQERGLPVSGSDDWVKALHSLEIICIRVQQGLWWIVYRARGERCGILSEAGVPPHSNWLLPIIACADEEVFARDKRIRGILGMGKD